MASCQALKTFGQPCQCVEYAAGDRQGLYVNCAVEGCGHTEEIHYQPSGEVKKVRR